MQLYTSTPLHLKGKYCTFTPLNLSDSFSYFSDYHFSYPSSPVKIMYLQIW